RAGGLDGIAAACGRREGFALRAAERAHHGPPALRWIPGPGDGYHAACAGNPEPEEAAERNLREAHRAAAEENRGRARARHVPHRGGRERLRHHRQGARKPSGGTREPRGKELTADWPNRYAGSPRPGTGLARDRGGEGHMCPFGAAIGVVTRHGYAF